MSKTQKLVLQATAVILAALCSVAALLAIRNYKVQQRLLKPPHDKTAIVGTVKNIDADLHFNYVPVKDGFSFGLCGNPIVEDDALHLYFASPSDNTVWLKAILYDESGQKIGQSEMLYPNEYIESIPLDIIPKDEGKITVKVLAYEPDTYYSMGIVNAGIQFTYKK